MPETHDSHDRMAAYKATCVYFELEPDHNTSAGEDYYDVIEGHTELLRFVSITSHDEIVYVTPVSDSLEHAQDIAVINIADRIWAQVPTAIVDLDTLEIHRPQWDQLQWAKSKNTMKLRDSRGQLVEATAAL